MCLSNDRLLLSQESNSLPLDSCEIKNLSNSLLGKGREGFSRFASRITPPCHHVGSRTPPKGGNFFQKYDRCLFIGYYSQEGNCYNVHIINILHSFNLK